MDKSKEHMIQQLVGQIEVQLGWGSGEQWSNKDFEELSERILSETKKRLSVTTLKRVWGRAERVANPSLATLDILAEFCGYSNWRDFANNEPETESNSETILKKKSTNLRIPMVLGAVVVLVMILAFYWPSNPLAEVKTPVDTTAFSFRPKVLSHDLPNSVVFEYDASAAPEGAKIEIQQDWDNNKRMTVNATDSVATSIYYKPGYFKSKLVVDGTIVEEADVFITTPNWAGTLEQDSIPIYLKTEDIKTDGQLGITPETVAEYHMDPRTNQVLAGLYWVQNFGELYTDDFQLTLQVKNTFKNGRTGCQWVKFFVLYDGGAIGVPLAKMGCVANLDLMAFGQYIDGRKADLSGLGVAHDDFISVQCTAQDGEFQILVDGQKAYTMPLPDMVKQIKGLTIHFEGAGTVKEVSLGNSTGLAFSN